MGSPTNRPGSVTRLLGQMQAGSDAEREAASAAKLGYTLRTVERKVRLIREKWDRTIPDTTE
jgi:hypothetical protein